MGLSWDLPVSHPRRRILVGTRPQRGGGGTPSTDPKIVTRNNVLCRRGAGDFVLGGALARQARTGHLF